MGGGDWGGLMRGVLCTLIMMYGAPLTCVVETQSTPHSQRVYTPVTLFLLPGFISVRLYYIHVPELSKRSWIYFCPQGMVNLG